MDETLLEHTRSGPELIEEVYRRHADLLCSVEPERFAKTLWRKANDMWQMMFEGVLSGEIARPYTFRNTLRELELDPEAGESLLESFEAVMLESTKLSPGVGEALGALREDGIAVGIITNGYTAMQRLKIRRHGLDAMVDHILISEAVGAHKPDRAIFEAALKAAGAQAAEAMHVGDHLTNDVSGAIGAGIQAVLYDPRGDRVLALDEEPGCPPPTHVVAALDEVVALARHGASSAARQS